MGSGFGVAPLLGSGNHLGNHSHNAGGPRLHDLPLAGLVWRGNLRGNQCDGNLQPISSFLIWSAYLNCVPSTPVRRRPVYISWGQVDARALGQSGE
jgi:hypothetical protein